MIDGREESVPKYEEILAADVVYDTYHPSLIPNVLSCLLQRSAEAIIYLVIPKRVKFVELIKEFEKEMINCGFKQNFFEEVFNVSK